MENKYTRSPRRLGSLSACLTLRKNQLRAGNASVDWYREMAPGGGNGTGTRDRIYMPIGG